MMERLAQERTALVLTGGGNRGAIQAGAVLALFERGFRPDLIIAGSGVDIVVLHVFNKETVPAFWDSSRDDFDEWSRDFVARFAQEYAAEFDLRAGAPGQKVLAASTAHGVDLIVLEWGQRLTPGHAEVIREVLTGTDVPVLLLPVPSVASVDSFPRAPTQTPPG